MVDPDGTLPGRGKKLDKYQFSQLRLLIILFAGIFFAEVLAMVLIYYINPAQYWLETLLDAVNMTVFISPVLYYYHYRPLLVQIRERNQDIAERKRVEQTLIHSNELIQRAFNSIDTLIAYMDRDFNFIQVNEAYARIGGHPAEYIPGKNHFDLYPHAENQAIFQRAVEAGEPYSVMEKPFEFPEFPERGVT